MKEDKVDVVCQIRQKREILPKKQKKLCDYIINNYIKVAFSSAQELAEETKTSLATIHRVSVNLGFKNYKDLKEKLKEYISETHGMPLNKMREALKALDENGLLEKIISESVRALEDLLNEQLLKAFPRSVDIIAKARRVYIIGLRSTRGIALYLHALLLQYREDVFLVDANGTDEMFEVLIDMKPQDVMIALMAGVPRYTKRTKYAIDFAHKNGVPIILITNSLSNAMIPLATETLLSPQNTSHYSAITFVAVCDAIVAAVGSKLKAESQKRLNLLSEVLVKYGISE